jgi:hypothetical protein
MRDRHRRIMENSMSRLLPAPLSFVLLPLFALAACATPETRVRTALMDAGLSRPVATCMAQRMVDRLSLSQLQRLSRLSGLSQQRIGDLTIAEFMRKARALGDPEILTVVTTAGIGCSIAA